MRLFQKHCWVQNEPKWGDRVVVFEYKDYRRFIRDFIEIQREIHPKFSLIYYSKKIKTSDGYLKLVVSGKRSLSLDNAFLLAKAFNLTPAEKSYFINLLNENESKEPSAKAYYKTLLTETAQLDISYSKNRKMTTIFEDRLLWEIFSLIGLKSFEYSIKYIKGKLRLPATDADIGAAVQKLLSLGAIRQDESGNVHAEDIVIPHRYNPAKAYATALNRAVKHVNAGIVESSYFDSFCLILNEDQYSQIRETLEEAKSKIAKIAKSKKDDKTLIAYLNLNLFLASK
jgi:uncharacterized protein (TIGR02147 family)